MSDPHAPYRALRNTDRRIAERLYLAERLRRYLELLRHQHLDAQQTAGQLLRVQAELESLRSERDRLIQTVSTPNAPAAQPSMTLRVNASR